MKYKLQSSWLKIDLFFSSLKNKKQHKVDNYALFIINVQIIIEASDSVLQHKGKHSSNIRKGA